MRKAIAQVYQRSQIERMTTRMKRVIGCEIQAGEERCWQFSNAVPSGRQPLAEGDLLGNPLGRDINCIRSVVIVSELDHCTVVNDAVVQHGMRTAVGVIEPSKVVLSWPHAAAS